MGKRTHGSKSQISDHERAIRGVKEYLAWRELAEWLETNPPVPVILRKILEEYKRRSTKAEYERTSQALELLIRDKYKTFAVLERMKGGEKK